MTEKLPGKLAKYLILLVIALAILLPVAWMASTAFKPTTEVMTGRSHWIPHTFTLDAFKKLFTIYPFADYYLSSIIVSSVASVIAVLCSLLSAYGVTRFQFRGRGIYLTYLLVTQMFPSIMLMIPAYQILQRVGLTNTRLGLILMYTTFTVPFCSWLMKGYLETIPLELDESAMIDGCPRIRTLFQILLPLAAPGMAATAIYAFIQTWNEYMYAYILITTEAKKTLPVGIGQLNGFYRTEWNEMMAGCLVAALPVVIAFLFLQKYFIASLTAGAVKM